jgi:hypothetical protein
MFVKICLTEKDIVEFEEDLNLTYIEELLGRCN